MTRGDIALEMGLPVRAVVGYAASFGDGLQKSVPAPGLGGLAAALGGADSPLGNALKQHGLTTDDIAVVYKHDTSTNANDPNENKLHQNIQAALGRTPGNPLWVVSQKTITGHAKGGAAAWQIGGLIQSLTTGVIPGNRNLDCVDEAMRGFEHIGFTDSALRIGEGEIRAGLVTSLGFGHVSGLALLIHPGVFLGTLGESEREAYVARVAERTQLETNTLTDVWMGRVPFFEKRNERRFESADGTADQAREETLLLTDPEIRLGSAGTYTARVTR